MSRATTYLLTASLTYRAWSDSFAQSFSFKFEEVSEKLEGLRLFNVTLMFTFMIHLSVFQVTLFVYILPTL
jgi:hypothetical protein